MNIFNYAVDYKSFLNLTNYTQFNWASNTTFAKNFGMSYLSSSFSSHAGSSVTYYYLLGAKIKGVMYGDSTLTGLKIISNEIPEIYSLSQNYPNPFNPSTKIEIKIPSREAEGSPWREYGVSRGVGLVTLQVYDITGRLIKTLIKQELQPGTYEVTFDGSGLNSGVYFYQMRTGNFTEIKKMILVK
jgi:hypothetical protein